MNQLTPEEHLELSKQIRSFRKLITRVVFGRYSKSTPVVRNLMRTQKAIDQLRSALDGAYCRECPRGAYVTSPYYEEFFGASSIHDAE